MANINELSSIDVATGSDLLATYSSSNGDTRKMSLTVLLDFFKDEFIDPDPVRTINTPVTGFNLTYTDNGNTQWLLLTPAGTLATGTVVLPSTAQAADGQECWLTSTQIITTLTVNGNGATALFGDPTTINEDAPFKLRYDKQTTSWYRVT